MIAYTCRRGLSYSYVLVPEVRQANEHIDHAQLLKDKEKSEEQRKAALLERVD